MRLGKNEGKQGIYLNVSTGELVESRGRELTLPETAGARYIRVPALAAMVLVPITGLAFVMFVPFTGLAAAVGFVGHKTWRTLKKKPVPESKPDGGLDMDEELVKLQEEIANRQQKVG